MSFEWDWNYLWTGVSVFGSGITIWQAWSARNAKKEVEKVRNQIHTYVFGNELSELIKEGNDLCKQMSPLIANNINQKTIRGIDENKIISDAIDFLSNCKVKSSLVDTIKKGDITKYYSYAQNEINQKKYAEVHRAITNILEIFEDERKKNI